MYFYIMEWIILFVAFTGAALSFFTGFGFGTILLPTMALFFDLTTAIMMTAFVHFLNTIYKLFLVGKYAHWPTVISFGVPSAIGAIAGALLLSALTSYFTPFQYSFMGIAGETSGLNIIMGILLITFSLFEYFNFLEKNMSGNKSLWVGGLLSGFFGGVSGQQGALRSAFLLHQFKDKHVFMGTRTVLAAIVDAVRITTYLSMIALIFEQQNNWPMIFAILGGIGGATVGNMLLQKISLSWIRKAIVIFLLVVGIYIMF
jgi:uncharacterized membrane protein YfcA